MKGLSRERSQILHTTQPRKTACSVYCDSSCTASFCKLNRDRLNGEQRDRVAPTSGSCTVITTFLQIPTWEGLSLRKSNLNCLNSLSINDHHRHHRRLLHQTRHHAAAAEQNRRRTRRCPASQPCAECPSDTRPCAGSSCHRGQAEHHQVR